MKPLRPRCDVEDVGANGGGGDDDEDGAGEEKSEGDWLFKKKREGAEEDDEERMVPKMDYEALEQKFTGDEEITEKLKRRFARGGKATGANAEDVGSDDEEDEEGFEGLDEDEDEEGDGEFEDLETGEKHGGEAEEVKDEQDEEADLEDERAKNAKRKEDLKLRFEEEDREGFLNPKNANRNADGTAEEREFGEDEWYDAQKALLQKQQDINRAEFEKLDEHSRIRAEG
ncbi:hypothetical protein KC343_g23164, partial [Hortaea werneckii]